MHVWVYVIGLYVPRVHVCRTGCMCAVLSRKGGCTPADMGHDGPVHNMGHDGPVHNRWLLIQPCANNDSTNNMAIL